MKNPKRISPHRPFLQSYSHFAGILAHITVKRKLADHKLEKMEGSARYVRRHCAGCYEKIREQRSREASVTAAKRIKTFCSDCGKFLT